MSSKPTKDARPVYSTEHGKTCPDCGEPISSCACRRRKAAVPAAPRPDGIVRVGRETQGRKGKGVTVVTGVPLSSEELRQLGQELKRKCGSGGTVKDGRIEIQGDHRDTLVTLLLQRGWIVRRTGG